MHGSEHLCLLTDEDGYVSFIDTNKKVGANGNSKILIDRWSCHNNAIFDVTWIPNTNLFLTASGDTTAALWDHSRPADKLGVFYGHSCSLKSISVSNTSNSKLFLLHLW